MRITHASDVWVDWRPVETVVDLACSSALRGMLRDPSSLAMPSIPAKKASSMKKRHCPVANAAQALAEVVRGRRRRRVGGTES